MGQDESTLVGNDEPCKTLSERTLAAVADLIKDGKAKNVVVLTGAGISTAAGIPDFRSPGTGLYHNLQRLNLPHPEAVFEIGFFRSNPDPFYVLAKELYPGNFHPTIVHAFIALLAHKGYLQMLFTQNIDCLERAAGVPGELIVEAHGSFATQRCIDCGLEYPADEMREHVRDGKVPRCKKCPGLVKPDIVFFGEGLPQRFYENYGAMKQADLVLIMGTSLAVHPFASLPQMVDQDVPRVLFNLNQVGGIGTRADDVLALGDCDSNVRFLAKELGWEEELESYWRSLVGEEEAGKQIVRARAHRVAGNTSQSEGDQDEEEVVGQKEVGHEISKLTDDMAAVLLGGDDTNRGGNSQRGESLALQKALTSTGIATQQTTDRISNFEPHTGLPALTTAQEITHRPGSNQSAPHPKPETVSLSKPTKSKTASLSKPTINEAQEPLPGCDRDLPLPDNSAVAQKNENDDPIVLPEKPSQD